MSGPWLLLLFLISSPSGLAQMGAGPVALLLPLLLLLSGRECRIQLGSRAPEVFLFPPRLCARRGAILRTPAILEEALAATDAFRRIRRERPAWVRTTQLLVNGTAPPSVTLPSREVDLLEAGPLVGAGALAFFFLISPGTAPTIPSPCAALTGKTDTDPRLESSIFFR